MAAVAVETDALRWPRTEEEREFEQVWQAGQDARLHESEDKNQREIHAAIGRKRWIRRLRYFNVLIARMSQLADVGQIRAEYRDLAGFAHLSTAALLIGERGETDEFDEDDAEYPAWPAITLGPLLVESGEK